MELIRGLAQSARASAGLRRHHRRLRRHAPGPPGAVSAPERARRASSALPTVLLTFEPHAAGVPASPQAPPARLTSLRERWRLLARMQPRLPVCCCASARHCVTCRVRLSRSCWRGTWPRGGRGRPRLPVRHATARPPRRVLAAAGRRLGFAVDVVPPVHARRRARQQQRRARSAWPRRLRAGAARWLGRPYSMRGRVVHGQQLGRDLGFPDGESALERRRAPLQGIFAVRVHGIAATARCPGWQAWARGRRLAARRRCSRRTCSISPATCTGARSKWSSWRSCATRSASRSSTRWSSRCIAMPRRRGAFLSA